MSTPAHRKKHHDKTRISRTFVGKLDYWTTPSRMRTPGHTKIKEQKKEKKKERSGRDFLHRKESSVTP